jgi:hypothetical protein
VTLSDFCSLFRSPALRYRQGGSRSTHGAGAAPLRVRCPSQKRSTIIRRVRLLRGTIFVLGPRERWFRHPRTGPTQITACRSRAAWLRPTLALRVHVSTWAGSRIPNPWTGFSPLQARESWTIRSAHSSKVGTRKRAKRLITTSKSSPRFRHHPNPPHGGGPLVFTLGARGNKGAYNRQARERFRG